MKTDFHALANAVQQGDRRALARLLTFVESETEGVDVALAQLYPHTGKAHWVGITGAPGTGKSTLVTALTKHYRSEGKTVGIIAVDPTSPFTGGAILGDRIRMRDLAGDSGTFIRSMATRGKLGGLARTTLDAARVLDAAGFDIVLIETVGAGQNEISIVRMAHTTIVVEAPGLGDDIQAIKAGILEIADILVVNKADRPGIINTIAALRAMLDLGHPTKQITRHHGQQMTVHAEEVPQHQDMWIAPILKTVAVENTGIAELADAIEKHHQFLEQANRKQILESQHIQNELIERLQNQLLQAWLKRFPPDTLLEIVDSVQAREIDPHTAVEELFNRGAIS